MSDNAMIVPAASERADGINTAEVKRAQTSHETFVRMDSKLANNDSLVRQTVMFPVVPAFCIAQNLAP